MAPADVAPPPKARSPTPAASAAFSPRATPAPEAAPAPTPAPASKAATPAPPSRHASVAPEREATPAVEVAPSPAPATGKPDEVDAGDVVEVRSAARARALLLTHVIGRRRVQSTSRLSIKSSISTRTKPTSSPRRWSLPTLLKQTLRSTRWTKHSASTLIAALPLLAHACSHTAPRKT